MLRRVRHIPAILIVAAALISGCENGSRPDESSVKFAYDEQFERGPLTVRARVSETEIGLSELTTLELQTRIEPGYEVQAPDIRDGLDKFRVYDVREMDVTVDGDGNRIQTRRYRLEPLEAGDWWLPGVVFSFRQQGPVDPNAVTLTRRTLSTEPIEIQVTSLVAEQGGEMTISEILPPADPPRNWWLPAGIAGGGLLLLGILIGWLARRRGGRRQVLRILKTPHEIAWQRIEELLASGVVDRGEYRPFYENLSDILRRYIEQRFGLRAPEQTSQEFLSDPRTAQVLEEDARAGLSDFLEHCDLIKFARQEASTEQMREALALVRAFIDRTRSEECRIDIVTGQRCVQRQEVA